jgi:hypothetical protein
MARRRNSTAKFISYDLRPAKQSERRILIDVLKVAGDCGLPVRQYRYIGMGANRFYDFLLLHRYLGVRDMVSLEHDPKMYERAVFNVPYKFIDVRNTTTVDFLAQDKKERDEILWLDYDGGIGPEVTQDIGSMATRAKLGDFCFVTVGGLVPPALDAGNDGDRLVSVKDVMGDVAGSLTVDDMQDSSFPVAVHKMLVAAFRNAFAPRTDGKFILLLQVVYRDSMEMVTVGGAFVADGTALELTNRLKVALPFLPVGKEGMYAIRSFNLTERERGLFDHAATAKSARCSERNTLKRMGFGEDDFDAYDDLIRYLPRYVETVV